MSVNLVWFRNDLRVADNIALSKACENGKVVAIYVFDKAAFGTTAFGFPKTDKFRAKFLIETVANLQKNLQLLSIRLLVIYENPENVIPKLVEDLHISKIFFQKEWTSEERKVENNIKSKLSENVDMISLYNQFLYEPSAIPFEIEKFPRVFTDFRKACEKSVAILPPLLIPKKLNFENFNIEVLDFKDKIPTLQDLGHDDFKVDERSAFPFIGGEDSSTERLQNYFWKDKNLQNYKQTRNGLIGQDYSSKFSAWLANGSISAKTIYAEVTKFEKQILKNEDTYWLIFELIWRDFFKYISLKNGSNIFKLNGILQKKYNWKRDETVIENWIKGKTKYDFVNANMNEIAATGFMSNRGRQNVASYFSKEMEQDWRIGASYFESLLVDYDVHSNWGNWTYNAGVGNDPRDRKFNIQSQADRYDPKNEYTELWLNK